MSRSESIEALRRANPRARAGFAQAVEAAADAIRERVGATPPAARARARGRRRLAGLSAGASLAAAAAAAAAIVLVGSPGGGPGVEDAAAAFEKAAMVTAASAERSGTAVVRITHNGEPWAGSTIRWHGDDLATSRGFPVRTGEAEAEFRLVDGMMYGVDAVDGDWVVLGSPASIDPESGTTPDEYLAAVRADVGGATLRRITQAVAGLTSEQVADGATVYRGTVTAGVIARETGVKEGKPIRVLPFGYVAHDEPDARMAVAATVGSDGILRRIVARWGTESSVWEYTVSYRGLGTTPAPAAPKHARPLRDRAR